MSEHEAPSAIMWAVKSPEGIIYIACETEDQAKKAFAGVNWGYAEKRGYRCVRVRITEVQDGGVRQWLR